MQSTLTTGPNFRDHLSTARDALTYTYFAQRGYACARVDMCGNGDSHGLMGISWGGFNSLQVAAMTPPELNSHYHSMFDS